MKHRKLYILIAIIVVLSIIILIPRKGGKTEKLVSANGLKDILIERQKDTVEIVISESGAMLVKPIDYPCDSMLVNRLITDIESAELGEVISKRKEKFMDFEVADGDLKITLAGKQKKSFYIGKYAGDYLNSYLRFPGDDKVYLVKGISKHMFDRKPDDWRDKTIITINRDNVSKIVIDDKHEIIKKDTVWYFEDIEIDKNKVNNLLNSFANFRASGFVDTLEFEPVHQVEIVLDNLTHKIEIGKKTETTYYSLRMEGKPTIFVVPEYIVNQITTLVDSQ